MNAFELQSCRKILMMNVSEASKHVGNVCNRTWQYWESGRNEIPSDVELKMKKLIKERTCLISDLREKDTEFCKTFENFLRELPDSSRIDFRVYQSAAAAIFIESLNDDGEE